MSDLNFLYDKEKDILEIEGIKYAGCVFRKLGIMPVNTFVRLICKEDGVITLQVYQNMFNEESYV